MSNTLPLSEDRGKSLPDMSFSTMSYIDLIFVVVVEDSLVLKKHDSADDDDEVEEVVSHLFRDSSVDGTPKLKADAVRMVAIKAHCDSFDRVIFRMQMFLPLDDSMENDIILYMHYLTRPCLREVRKRVGLMRINYLRVDG